MAMNVAGYATTTSVVAGSAINFCLSSNFDKNFNLRIERVNSGTPSTSFSLALSTQPVPALVAWEGFGWLVNHTFTVPANWPPGLYQLVEVGSTAVLRFVVRPAVAGQTSKILLQVSFLTPQVYSANGGKSLYDFNSGGGRASRVSFDRTDGLPDDRFEPPILDWLEKAGYTVDVARVSIFTMTQHCSRPTSAFLLLVTTNTGRRKCATRSSGSSRTGGMSSYSRAIPAIARCDSNRTTA